MTHNPEQQRDELFSRFQKIGEEMAEIYLRIEGLGDTRKDLREEKFESLRSQLRTKQEERDGIRKELQSLSPDQP